ncbi:MAG: hypothetical protein NZ534_00010 [Bacteroidia bacterium]|nr:hypothetical protein [Bacteroidia bacterium]
MVDREKIKAQLADAISRGDTAAVDKITAEYSAALSQQSSGSPSALPQALANAPKHAHPYATIAYPVTNAAASLALLPADAGVWLRNKLRNESYQLPSEMFRNWLDRDREIKYPGTEKALEFATGLVIGLPRKAAQTAGSALLGSPFAKQVAHESIRKAAGPIEQRRQAAALLRQKRPVEDMAEDFVVTAADRARDVPAGRNIVAMQRELARTYGAPTVELAERQAANKEALRISLEKAKAAHREMREKALAGVMVQPTEVKKAIRALQYDPRLAANEAAQSVLRRARGTIARAQFHKVAGDLIARGVPHELAESMVRSNEALMRAVQKAKVPAATLDQMRQLLGEQLRATLRRKHLGPSAAAVSQELGALKDSISAALKKGGVKDYEKVLEDYFKNVVPREAALKAQKTLYRMEHPPAVGLGQKIKETETAIPRALPPWIDPTLSFVKRQLINALQGYSDTVQREVLDLFQDPNRLASVLEVVDDPSTLAQVGRVSLDAAKAISQRIIPNLKRWSIGTAGGVAAATERQTEQPDEYVPSDEDDEEW